VFGLTDGAVAAGKYWRDQALRLEADVAALVDAWHKFDQHVVGSPEQHDAWDEMHDLVSRIERAAS